MSVAAEVSDSELVRMMAAGDSEAFAALYSRYQATVYRFCRQMLGSTDAAEDITHDVFIALAKDAGRFNAAIASLTTYLYGIARNLIYERHRRNRVRREVDIDAVGNGAAFHVEWDPTTTLARTQMVRHLRLAILHLPLGYREVVVLCELNGLSYEQAATIVKCPVGTIRSRLSRARRMLIQRCRALLSVNEHSADLKEGRQKWLIATKNSC